MVCLMRTRHTAGTLVWRYQHLHASTFRWSYLGHILATKKKKKRRQLWSSQNSQRVPVVLQISGGAAEPSPWSAAPLVGGQDTRRDAWQISSIKICSAEPTIGAQRGKISGFSVEDKQLCWKCLQSGKRFTRAAQGPACDLGFEPGCRGDCQGDWSSLSTTWLCACGHFTAVTLCRAPWLVTRLALNISLVVLELHTRSCKLQSTRWDPSASADFCFWPTKCILRWWTGLPATLFLQESRSRSETFWRQTEDLGTSVMGIVLAFIVNVNVCPSWPGRSCKWDVRDSEGGLCILNSNKNNHKILFSEMLWCKIQQM